MRRLLALAAFVCIMACAQAAVLNAPCGCKDCEECTGEVPGEACKEYKCLDNVCKKAKMLDCCPNEICETSEDYGNCPGDCMPKVVSVEVLNPAAGSEFMRGDSIPLKVRVNADGRAVASADVEASSTLGDMRLENDGSHGDDLLADNVYGNYLEVGQDAAEGTHTIAINTEFLGVRGQGLLEIAVKPRMGSELALPQTMVLGDILKISGSVKKRGVGMGIPLDVNAIQGGKNIFHTVVQSAQDGSFSAEYHSSLLDAAGVWNVRVFGAEPAGNYALAEGSVVVNEPETVQLLEIGILSRIADIYGRGSSIMVVAKAYDKGNVVSGARCDFIAPNGERVELRELQDGQYSALYKIPFDSPLGAAEGKVMATYRDQNVAYGGEAVFNTTIAPAELEVSVVKPERKSFKVGERIELMVEVSYPSGSLVANADAKALVFGKEIRLGQVSKGMYAADYIAKEDELGETKVFFGVSDAYENVGYESAIIDVSGVGTEYYASQYGLLVAIAAAAAVVVIAFVAVIKVKKSGLERLKAHERESLGKLKDLQRQYFEERTIGERGYRELLAKYELELAAARKSIEVYERRGRK